MRTREPTNRRQCVDTPHNGIRSIPLRYHLPCTLYALNLLANYDLEFNVEVVERYGRGVEGEGRRTRGRKRTRYDERGWRIGKSGRVGEGRISVSAIYFIYENSICRSNAKSLIPPTHLLAIYSHCAGNARIKLSAHGAYHYYGRSLRYVRYKSSEVFFINYFVPVYLSSTHCVQSDFIKNE